MPQSQDGVIKSVVNAHADVVVLNSAGLMFTFFIQTRWDRLMKAAQFGSWPPASGLAVIYLGVAGTCTTSSVVSFLRKRWQLKTLLIVSTATLMFALMELYGVITIGCPDMTSARPLSPELDPVATFNRGVCTVWCHTLDPKSAAEMGEACRATCDPAFESLASKPLSTLGVSWCEQAIRHDSFPANATYEGLEPFSTLTHDKDVCVSGDWLPLVAFWFTSAVGMALASECLVIEALARKSRATTAMGELEDEVNEPLLV